jgi:hypothetical protein
VGKSDASVVSTGNHARINKAANTERKWGFPQPADSERGMVDTSWSRIALMKTRLMKDEWNCSVWRFPLAGYSSIN